MKQLTAKDNEISHLQSQLNAIDHANSQELAVLQEEITQLKSFNSAQNALHEAEIASLKAANESLTENFNRFKSVLTSIDQMTDEVID